MQGLIRWVVLSLLVLSPVQAVPSQTYETSFWGRFFVKIDVTKNSEGNPIVRYNIDMPANTYFSFGYGKNMRNVDMVVWLAGSSGVVVQDLYSYGDYTPDVDSHQDYTTTKT